MAKKQGKLRLKSGARVYGPMTRADLAELAAKGRLKPGDEVSYDNGPWMSAEDYLRATADRPGDSAPGIAPHPARVPPVHTETAPFAQPADPSLAAAAEIAHAAPLDAPQPAIAPPSGPTPPRAAHAPAGLSGVGMTHGARSGQSADPAANTPAVGQAKAATVGPKGGSFKSAGEQRNLQVIKGSRKYPPMTRSQICELLASGRVTPDDLICAVGGPWMTVEDYFSSRPIQTRAATHLPESGPPMHQATAAPLETLTEADVVAPPGGLAAPAAMLPQARYTPAAPHAVPTPCTAQPQYAPPPDYGQWPQPAQPSPWATQPVYPPEAAVQPGLPGQHGQAAVPGTLPFGAAGVAGAASNPGFPAAAPYPGQPGSPMYAGQASGAGPPYQAVPGYGLGTPGTPTKPFVPMMPGTVQAQLAPEVLGVQDIVGAAPATQPGAIPGFLPGQAGPPLDLELEALADEWCVRVHGVPSTRLQRRHIKQLLDAGEIGPDASCAHMSWPNNQWKQLKDIPQLASLLRGTR